MSNAIKQQLRAQYLTVLKNISSEEKAQWDASIFEQFANSEYFKRADTVALYVSLPYEVATTKIIDFLLANNKKVALPRIQDQDLVFYYINSTEDLIVDNQWMIQQPKEANQIAENKDFDLIILPLVAFNQKYYRLGHGKGYYDRFLTKTALKALKLVLAYQVQEISLDVFFVDSWDVKFDALITNV